jgi:membrane protein
MSYIFTGPQPIHAKPRRPYCVHVSIWQLIKTTFQEWQDDQSTRLAAALSYYTVFSLAPLLIIVISVVGLVIGQREAQGQIVAQIAGYVGEESAGFIEGILEQMSQPRNSTLATLIGIITLLLGATGVFGELQASLNQIWDVPPKKVSAQQGIRALLFNRVLSFGMVLAVGFLLLVSLIISTAVTATSTWLIGDRIGMAIISQGLNFLLGFAVITLMFALIFKFLPDTKIHWRDVWPGAALTAVLFSVGRLLISFYLSQSSTASVYGAAGSLVVLLLWVYYSAQILFFGAEFTQVYSRRHDIDSLATKRKQQTLTPPRAQTTLPKLTPGATPAVQPATQPATLPMRIQERKRKPAVPLALAGAAAAVLFMTFKKMGRI